MRRCAVLDSAGPLGAYVHGTRIGALVALAGGTARWRTNSRCTSPPSNPRYISAREVPAEVVAKEREILAEQAQGEGKPPEIVAKMVEGRLRKSLDEIALLGQPFIKDPDRASRSCSRAPARRSCALRALRGRRRHREEAGRFCRRGHGPGQPPGATSLTSRYTERRRRLIGSRRVDGRYGTAPCRNSTRCSRILVKLSGEALLGRPTTASIRLVLKRIALEIGEVQALGVQVAIVIGGGNIFRGAGLARAGMDRVTADQMGMLATVMNALALQDAIEQQGCRRG